MKHALQRLFKLRKALVVFWALVCGRGLRGIEHNAIVFAIGFASRTRQGAKLGQTRLLAAVASTELI